MVQRQQSKRQRSIVLLAGLTLCVGCLPWVEAFSSSIVIPTRRTKTTRQQQQQQQQCTAMRHINKKEGSSWALSVSSSSSSNSGSDETSTSTTPTDTATSVATLRVREIKQELDTLGVQYKDCFDKESLVQRLQDARSGKIKANKSSRTKDEENVSSTSPKSATATSTTNETTTTSSSSSSSFQSTSSSQSTTNAHARDTDENKQTVLAEIRGMRVKELRQELAERHVRWGGLLEKEDLVQAVYKARQEAANFSVTGLITPGQVALLSGDQVQTEVEDTTTTNNNNINNNIKAPLLVDAYATWCGPCQMMAPQLAEAAAAWGNQVRVCKFDTDQYPTQASKWRIQGLPTLLLFHHGKLIARIEGALMKDQLLQWVDSELAKHDAASPSSSS